MDFGQDFNIDPVPLFIPNNISKNTSLAAQMLSILTASHILPFSRIAKDHGVRFFLTTQSRGRAYWHHNSKNRRVITIPEWVFCGIGSARGKPRYEEYYICHELSHIFNWIEHAREADPHGPKFMRQFKLICPPEIQHYELNYKPRNAQAAGVFDFGMDSNGMIDF